MMSRSQSVVSVYYDAHQDRLKFLLTMNKQEQIEGSMTRRLLKAMLNQLPEWLAKQNTVKTAIQQESVLTSTQQQTINQFQHQAAQYQVQNQQAVKANKKVERFLIETVSLSSAPKQGSGLEIAIIFLSVDKQDSLRLVFTLEQLYQFILVVLGKSSEWDLRNPWLIEGCNSSEVIH